VKFRNSTVLNPLLHKSHIHLSKPVNVDALITDGIIEYYDDSQHDGEQYMVGVKYHYYGDVNSVHTNVITVATEKVGQYLHFGLAFSNIHDRFNRKTGRLLALLQLQTKPHKLLWGDEPLVWHKVGAMVTGFLYHATVDDVPTWVKSLVIRELNTFKFNKPDACSYMLYVTVDANDADYLHATTPITIAEINTLRPLFNAINSNTQRHNFEYDWDLEDVTDPDHCAIVYNDYNTALNLLVDKFLPSGECERIHTIKSIELLQVTNNFKFI
jgi:hypothetical protein